MVQERQEDKYLPDPATGVRRQVAERTQKWRGAVSWAPARGVRWTVRHDIRLERTPALNEKANGRLWVADALFVPRPKTRIKVRTYFFNSPEAYLTTGPEEIWDGVDLRSIGREPRAICAASPGTRTYVILGQEWGSLRFWGKYEMTNRPAQSEGRADVAAPARRAWHLQVDGRWGNSG
jgi:hypothetical protein